MGNIQNLNWCLAPFALLGGVWLANVAWVFPGEDLWPFELLRTWASAPNGPNETWNGDTSTGAAGHPEISPEDPLYRRLVARFSRESGVVAETKVAGKPYGKLVRWDLDGDGKEEIVFVGGAAPQPYFVILRGQARTWDVWFESWGRLLAATRRSGSVVLVAALDGYGVERDHGLKLFKLTPGAQAHPTVWTFRWVGDLNALASQGDVTACAVKRTTSLRSGPKVDTTPEESGMGFDWPGNLCQMLAEGSEGWCLKNTGHALEKAWALVAFADAPDSDDPLKTMTTPWKAGRFSSSEGGERSLRVGWIRLEDLQTR